LSLGDLGYHDPAARQRHKPKLLELREHSLQRVSLEEGLIFHDPTQAAGAVAIPVVSAFDLLDKIGRGGQRGDVEEEAPELALKFDPGAEKAKLAVLVSSEFFY
jgi:hypothetical protein